LIEKEREKPSISKASVKIMLNINFELVLWFEELGRLTEPTLKIMILQNIEIIIIL
jgi:hypothetical protein